MANAPQTSRLPVAGLLALAMTGFIAILTETMPGGGVAGGALLATAGLASFAWVLLGLLCIALVLAWKAKAHGFTQGPSNKTETPIERSSDERAIICK